MFFEPGTYITSTWSMGLDIGKGHSTWALVQNAVMGASGRVYHGTPVSYIASSESRPPAVLR